MNEFYDSIGSVTTVNNATIGLMLAINEIKRPHGRFVLMPSFTFSVCAFSSYVVWFRALFCRYKR